jgi:cytochrome c553
MGHPESASLAGLSVNYMIQQLRDYRSGARKSLGDRGDSMIAMAAAMTDEEMRVASEYFAGLPVIRHTRVVETGRVPETYVGGGNMRHAKAGGGTEPIGQRIIEFPENSELQELEDSHSRFVAYVPPGSIAKGRELATTGGGKTIACSVCHGGDLKGLGDVPRLVGQSPIYMVRQMMDIRHGARRGSAAALMTGVVANLTQEDMVNLAAYIGSLDP